MTDESMPAAVDRAAFEAEIDSLRVREKVHIREGDAIAAARRRLPMVEVDATLELIGPDGPLTLLDAFEGRRQLVAYYFMWHDGHPAAEQCEGCTWVTTHCIDIADGVRRGDLTVHVGVVDDRREEVDGLNERRTSLPSVHTRIVRGPKVDQDPVVNGRGYVTQHLSELASGEFTRSTGAGDHLRQALGHTLLS